MKYLAVMDSLGAGGAERSNTDFWFYAREHGVEIKIVVMDRREHGTEKEVLEGNFDVTVLEGKGVFNHARQIKRFIADYRPDVVHSTLFKSNLRTRLAKLLGARFLHVESLVNTTYDYARLHDPNVKLYKMEGYRMLDALTMNLFTDHLHAITDQVGKHYRSKLFVPNRKISIINRGRNPNAHRSSDNRKDKYQAEFGLQDNTLVFISVGRQEFQKGHVYMLDALSKLRDTHDFHDFKWLLVGRKGHASQAIQDKIAELSLKDYVIEAGHRYDVESLLPAADVYVFPSLYEGLGVALLEAQSAGLPIVCSDIAVFHEVNPAQGVVYVDPLNTEDFAAQLFSLTNDPARRSSMGKASLENFTQRFLLDDIHAQMLGYFQRLVDQRRA